MFAAAVHCVWGFAWPWAKWLLKPTWLWRDGASVGYGARERASKSDLERKKRRNSLSGDVSLSRIPVFAVAPPS